MENIGDDFRNLQIPRILDIRGDYGDAALDQDPQASVGADQAAGIRMDVITPTGEAIPAYTVGGQVVGQRIEKTRTKGLESRVAFFSFGFEAVNRRYYLLNGSPATAETRFKVARNILQYFKTGVLSGTVINDATNQPIPDFLVKVTNNDTGVVYLARTGADGKYELTGLPPSDTRVSNDFRGYTVEAAFILNGALVTRTTPGAQTSPGGFFGGENRTGVNISAGEPRGNQNLRPVPATPGSFNGRVVTSKSTPFNFADDEDPLDPKAVNMAVLLKSIDETDVVPGGGYYARIARTDNRGRFSFDTVPSNVPMQVIFNPTKADIPSGSVVLDTNGQAYAGPNTTFGRRVIADARRPGLVVV
ncbi:MAG: carboxypeptidase regulatory-like domain-containing protein, partial [Verrucomicrobiaceae bacterium]